MRCTWQSIAPAVRIRPLPDRISVDGPMTSAGIDAVHRVGVAGLADADDAAVAHADVGLDHAPVVEDQRAGDDQIGRALPAARCGRDWPIDSRITLPPPNTASSPPAHRSSLDLDQQVGVGQADAVAGGRAVQPPVAGRARSQPSPAPTHRGAPRPRRAGRPRCGRRRSAPASTLRAMPGSKRTDVPAAMSSRWPRAASRSNSSAGLASAKW